MISTNTKNIFCHISFWLCGLIFAGLIIAGFANQPTVTKAEEPIVDYKNGVTAGRDSGANATAINKLGLVSWGTSKGAVLKTDQLNLAVSQGEVFKVIAALGGEEFAQEQQAIYQNQTMDSKILAQILLDLLKLQGMEAPEALLMPQTGQALTRANFADLIYQTLAIKKAIYNPADQTWQAETLAQMLVQEDTLNERLAVLADLPVKANTDENYKTMWTEQWLTQAEPFIYTAKNKALMKQLCQDPTSPFVYVSKTANLPASFVPPLISKQTLPTKGSNNLMQPIANQALAQLFAGAKNSSMPAYLRSGYRSYNTQISLYGNGDNPYRAKQGQSEHQTGLAADVTSNQNALSSSLSSSPFAKWLAGNSYKYGFNLRYPPGKEAITGYPAEWWHVRYIGKTPAYECYTQKITFDEFYQRLCK